MWSGLPGICSLANQLHESFLCTYGKALGILSDGPLVLSPDEPVSWTCGPVSY
jgi:hypothetical protein